MKNKYAKAVIGGAITGALIACKVMITCYQSGYATGVREAEGDKDAERTFKAITAINKEITSSLKKKK